MRRSRCESCDHFDRITDTDEGFCRAHPPVPFYQVELDGSGRNNFETLWPVVKEKNWCGEFKIKMSGP